MLAAAEPATTNIQLERTCDPDSIRQLEAAADRPITVGGPGLAGQALTARLVDELHLFLHPVLVGGGTAALPDGLRLDLDLIDERRFASGVVHLHHHVRR